MVREPITPPRLTYAASSLPPSGGPAASAASTTAVQITFYVQSKNKSHLKVQNITCVFPLHVLPNGMWSPI